MLQVNFIIYWNLLFSITALQWQSLFCLCNFDFIASIVAVRLIKMTLLNWLWYFISSYFTYYCEGREQRWREKEGTKQSWYVRLLYCTFLFPHTHYCTYCEAPQSADTVMRWVCFVTHIIRTWCITYSNINFQFVMQSFIFHYDRTDPSFFLFFFMILF